MRINFCSEDFCGWRSFRLSALLLMGWLAMLAGVQNIQAQTGPLRIAIVGLEHGHVDGFLHGLPQHKDVELVGVVEADQALAAKYEKKFDLPQSLFFPSIEAMNAARHPQAVLVYTPVGEPRMVIETAARMGVASAPRPLFVLIQRCGDLRALSVGECNLRAKEVGWGRFSDATFCVKS